jgi:hypothetical protein
MGSRPPGRPRPFLDSEPRRTPGLEVEPSNISLTLPSTRLDLPLVPSRQRPASAHDTTLKRRTDLTDPTPYQFASLPRVPRALSSTTRPFAVSRRPKISHRTSWNSMCAFSPMGQVRVSEVWDSQEQLNAFGERLMPVLADVGIDPGQPETFEVHNVIKR